jgi:threonine/homoserine/homoserine lactone efflux protein
MNENWVMLVIGLALIVFGVTMTAVSGPMPGAKSLYRAPLRFRLILIFFGALMAILGVARLTHR